MTAHRLIEPAALAEATGDHAAVSRPLTVAEIVAKRDAAIDAAKAEYWKLRDGLSWPARDKLRLQIFYRIEDIEKEYEADMRRNMNWILSR